MCALNVVQELVARVTDCWATTELLDRKQKCRKERNESNGYFELFVGILHFPTGLILLKLVMRWVILLNVHRFLPLSVVSLLRPVPF